MTKKIFKWFFCQPDWIDAIALSLFAVAITWQPFLLYQTVNLPELGLYLPGLGAILHGQVPYRDFFYLRGPFELYLPAFLMRLFGEHLAVLSTYFYVGTVIALITCVWIACEVFTTRIFLYTMVPVLIARTFPRVVFAYWGGMRYAWGLLAIFCVIRFFSKNQKRWLLISGLLTAVAGLTSIEIGVSVFAAFIIGIVLCRRNWQKTIFTYMIGIGIIFVPYFLYMAYQGAWADYAKDQWVIVTQLNHDFLKTEVAPSNVGQFFHALIVMTDKNFRQITPVYCYLAFAIYLFLRQRRRRLDKMDYSVIVIAIYGIMIYFPAWFRSIWTSVFEMSLQPEKIVLFYVLARGSLQLLSKQHFKKIAYMLITAIVISSFAYCIPRFSKRFFVFWRKPFKNQISTKINLPRIKGMVLPQWQAADFIQLKQFVDTHTLPGELIWMFPELGAIHFIVERPWIGKFPTATLTWFSDEWYEQYMRELKRVKPRYAIFEKKSPKHFEEEVGLSIRAKNKFKTQMSYLQENYFIISETPTYNIYIRNDLRKGS